ncbi:hypothetical protein CA600_12200 [Paenibacillus sp. VTT E-133280]|uniref:hypothetical protein n=1 Tax=unclassified Paenibacillus TaxID=185978 RepID=UPI000BA16FB4|nr:MULTISPECIES: hypothetical protein [unclassified Paenibacillus]MDH6373861.1 hypothetical protein [Paenibacillus sp. PastF-3]OZQ66248.1 hypothetical protein CA600_12200 [Paenibacillus sp. VTT E-133280]OZQ81224.1 hypothetical protein CA598_26785 [Paenibacillus sp. VTT E-133291]
MENISTGLKWVIGIIVTILIIAAGVSIYLVINNYFIRAQEQTLAQTQMINQAEFNSYDNKDVSGQDVINAAMRYKGRPQFAILIKTGENTTGFYAENTYKSSYEEPKDTSNPVVDLSKNNKYTKGVSVSTMLDQTNTDSYNRDNYLVNTLSVFKAVVYKDSNEEVRLIVFKQK